MKSLFNNKPWKEWKTRKATLVFSIFCVCLYTTICLVMSFFDKTPDTTLTSEIFDFFKWLVITGCAITIIRKNSKQSSEESQYDESQGEM